MRRSSAINILALTVAWLFVMQQTPAQAEIIYGIIGGIQGNNIFTFDRAAPGTLLTFQPVSGFVTDAQIGGGIDIRPTNGKLYGTSSDGRIYTVDPLTGIATLASTIRSTQPLPTTFSVDAIDFDPVADRLRVAFNNDARSGGNLSVNVYTGDAVVDGALHFAQGDVQTNVFTSGIAYTSNSGGATATTLYAVTPNDAGSWVLDMVDPPRTGTMHSIGLLNAFGTSAAGFDVSGVTGNAGSDAWIESAPNPIRNAESHDFRPDRGFSIDFVLRFRAVHPAVCRLVSCT